MGGFNEVWLAGCSNGLTQLVGPQDWSHFTPTGQRSDKRCRETEVFRGTRVGRVRLVVSVSSNQVRRVVRFRLKLQPQRNLQDPGGRSTVIYSGPNRA